MGTHFNINTYPRGKQHGQVWQKRNFGSTKRNVFLVLLLLSLIFLLISNEKTPSAASFIRSASTEERCKILKTSSPDEISKLTTLDLKGCSLKSIPSSIGYATNLLKLDVSNNPKLKTLPSELAKCTKLGILFVSSCPSISRLPPVLGQMQNITRLGWRSGSLSYIDPKSLPPNLVHLILTDNQIVEFDDPLLFQRLQYVRKLMLSHNGLRTFGEKSKNGIATDNSPIKNLQNLELLRLGGNQLQWIPSDLWTLPKLTWLTISGNPVTSTSQKATDSGNLPKLTMNDLVPTKEFLGKGASGSVNAYHWKDKEVAVKLIHGVTSDGRAEDELAAYDAVGSTAFDNRVVGCLALLDATTTSKNEKNSKRGIVMERLPAQLTDLALPPTIVEVTKDRWIEKDTNKPPSFSSTFVINVLRDIVTAMVFLHNTVKVAHGDVYAHNMKVDRQNGRAFLLDLGASYFVQPEFAIQAEKLEVRAFGILVLELLSLLEETEENQRNFEQKLATMHEKCTNPNVEQRPSFVELQNEINSFPNGEVNH